MIFLDMTKSKHNDDLSDRPQQVRQARTQVAVDPCARSRNGLGRASSLFTSNIVRRIGHAIAQSSDDCLSGEKRRVPARGLDSLLRLGPLYLVPQRKITHNGL
jgi:hypothetical protein